MQQQFQSTVGSVIDVATPSTGKLRALGFLWAIIALFPLAIINYVIIEALTSSDPIVIRPVYLAGSLLMPVLAWYALGSAVQRFRAASTEDRYFRSGPGGISICLPDDYASSTFRFSLAILKFDLPWDQIKTWYPFVQTMNGIPTDRSIVFETVKNQKFSIRTYHFAEKQKEIAANIGRSKLVVPEDGSEPGVEQPPAEQEFKVPASAGELSLEIKKKRDLLKELDLRTVAQSERAAYVQRTADALEAKVPSLFESAAGFRCSRKSYRPFKEWTDVSGVRLVVRRGLLDGYEIQIEPNDSECRRVTISMCPSSLISDIRRYVAMGVGAVYVVMSFSWLLENVRYWLGDLRQLTPLVMVAIFFAVVAVVIGALQLPISLLRLLICNKETEEAQKQGIKLGVQEITI
jgi:hypothetical protein